MLKRLAAAAAVAATAGCVDRRFVVESNVPGAQISIDGNPLGPAPADAPFVYAGKINVTASAPGYETLTERVWLKPKWYQYPPIDLLAECVYPGRIDDVRRIRINLVPAKPLSDAELLAAGDALRARGQALPPPVVPNDQPTPGPRPVPGTANLPTQTGLNPTNPLSPGNIPGQTGPFGQPQVPATVLGPLSNPRDGDTRGGVLRPGGGP